MKFSRKIIAAVLVLTLAFSMVAALAQNMLFTGSAYGYELKNGYFKKTSIIIKKGSILEKAGAAYKNKTPIWIDKGNTNYKTPLLLYFPTKYLKATSKAQKGPFYGAGGSGRSTPNLDTLDYSASLKGKKILCDTGKCNIRKTPSLAGKSLGVFRIGKKMTMTGFYCNDSRGVTWYEVKYTWKEGGVTYKTAWVSEVYTTF